MTSATQAAIARAPLGISDAPMTGAWRIIIARTSTHTMTWLYHANDDKRSVLALRCAAQRWFERQMLDGMNQGRATA